jgi:hypothetical protein
VRKGKHRSPKPHRRHSNRGVSPLVLRRPRFCRINASHATHALRGDLRKRLPCQEASANDSFQSEPGGAIFRTAQIERGVPCQKV